MKNHNARKKPFNKSVKREQWKSRLGFIWAAVGSSIGLGSIWRFPYVVGENGGATFVILYLICLVLIGFPVLITEIVIGRKTQLNPSGAFMTLGKHPFWKKIGMMTIITGFLVSSFYAVISGWAFGYFIETLFGGLTNFKTSQEALHHFKSFSTSPYYSLGSLFGFITLSAWVLYTGVRKGLELGNKIMMPLLLFVLILLVIKGVTMPGGSQGIAFLFKPNWSYLTPTAILMALGQAFFSLSLGQGTMVTYGSYIGKKENLPMMCLPIALFGICVSLLAGVAIFTIVFSHQMILSSGESLMFQTLPIIFSKIPGGYFLSLLFFMLLLLAALTSQISAMEPLIAFFIDVKKWKRHQAVIIAAISVFIMAIPCALFMGFLKGMNFICVNVLIPLGGLAAVILIGWRLGIKKGLTHLKEGAETLFDNYPGVKFYFHVSIKYLAPLIIFLILLDNLIPKG